MKTRMAAGAAFAALCLAAGLISAQDDLSSGASAKDEVTLRCTARPAKTRPLLRLEGKAPFPDETMLGVALQRLEERDVAGRLEPAAAAAGSGLKEVRNGEFLHELRVEKPGAYRVLVDLADDLQERKILKALSGKFAVRHWKFEVSAWGDDLAAQFCPKLREVDDLVQEALDLIAKFEAACVTPEDWEAQKKTLPGEGSRLVAKVRKTDAQKLYPASVGVLHATLRDLLNASSCFVWKEGKLAGGASYHTGNQPMKTFRQEEFSYDNFRKYAKEAEALAGREFALWIIKDFRRAGARGALKEALQEQSKHPGVSPFAERLERFEDFDAIEKEIRGER